MKKARTEFDNTKLTQFIDENFKTRKAFAEFLGITPATLKRRLENKAQFTSKDIQKVLFEARPQAPITPRELDELFFTEKGKAI